MISDTMYCSEKTVLNCSILKAVVDSLPSNILAVQSRLQTARDQASQQQDEQYDHLVSSNFQTFNELLSSDYDFTQTNCYPQVPDPSPLEDQTTLQMAANSLHRDQQADPLLTGFWQEADNDSSFVTINGRLYLRSTSQMEELVFQIVFPPANDSRYSTWPMPPPWQARSVQTRPSTKS